MKKLSIFALAMVLLFTVLAPQALCGQDKVSTRSVPVPAEGYKLQAEMEWWRSLLYTMSWQTFESGKEIKTLDKSFDCDDWAILHVLYIAGLYKIENPGILVVHKEGKREGHAMGYYIRDGKHVVCDGQSAYSMACDSYEICLKAAAVLWETVYGHKPGPEDSYHAHVEPLDKMIRENWR